MPPRKGIVQSGNSGNSSKAGKQPPPTPSSQDSRVEKSLFPPGVKTPLSLLHERCQKNGWDKPLVDTHKHGNGWSFVITLSRSNPKTSSKDSVRLEPHPPKLLASALEARHWGATYALYRFCNGIQLNRVLPAGPREYWSELAAEHKNSPDHLKWMYDRDPFAAREAVSERQAKAAQRKEENEAVTKKRTDAVSNEFSLAPEVQMALSLRDKVEDAVKKTMALFPGESADEDMIIQDSDKPVIRQSLLNLGFSDAQARNAIQFLSHSSVLATELLSSLKPLEAAIEYLILHVPECDLPKRFLPDSNSSNPFITSTHSGQEDLKTRWVEKKAVSEAGWPVSAVKECLKEEKMIHHWDLLMATLCAKLIDFQVPTAVDPAPHPNVFLIDAEEASAFGAEYLDRSHLTVPLFSAPITLHVHIQEGNHPRPGFAAMYLTSSTTPSYIRLHLLSVLLLAMHGPQFLHPGEGFIMATMRILEETWAQVELNGPPDMGSVLRYILKPPQVPKSGLDASQIGGDSGLYKGKPRKTRVPLLDGRTSQQILSEFNELCNRPTYKEMLASRQKLPAYASKDQFLQMLSNNQVTVVVGDTGCGKTTQLPQFILDSLIQSGCGAKASIIVTQPRRISAIGVATRVSTERLDDGSVGYSIRGETNQTRKTKLLFCTTGVVLRRLAVGDRLNGVSHVVVDEVHERSLDGDFLLIELKQLLRERKDLKVILMSATINHEIFIRYFDDAPLLSIPGFTHPVIDRYLEDFVPSIGYRPTAINIQRKENDRTLYEELKSMGLNEQGLSAVQTIVRSDRIDYQLIAALSMHIIKTSEKCGGILIFLSGVQEIRQCLTAIQEVVSSADADVLPLHANLSSDEQRRVFNKTSKWKIIAATNVAETSITIDDVIYVIDSGKVKETKYDAENSMSRLEETWVTRAAARQRRGRAGRTQPGTCFKLYTRKQERDMESFPTPEILRVPLESISLSVKAMREEEDVKSYLGQAIDPPEVSALDKAWSVLQELGAIDTENKMTSLGRYMSMLPVDLRLGKMLILAAIFRCLNPILTIAACLSSKPLFFSPMDQRDEANAAKARFSSGASDLLTDLRAYDDCLELRKQGKSQSALFKICEENFISTSTIREVTIMRNDFFSSLTELGLVPYGTEPSSPSLNANTSNVNLLKSIILGGLYSRVARVHLPKSAIKYDQVQGGTVRRENTAKEFKMFDVNSQERVFLHPSSILFGNASWKSGFIAYFHKQMTSKLYLRGVTEVPMYALLLFGGTVSVNHVAGGLTVGKGDVAIKLKAWPRIGILVNQLRRLLDIQLQRCIEEGTMVNQGDDNLVVNAMLSLITYDGLQQFN